MLRLEICLGLVSIGGQVYHDANDVFGDDIDDNDYNDWQVSGHTGNHH